MKRLAIVGLWLCCAACPGPSQSDGGVDGGGGAPFVSSLSPDHGPLTGGTLVTLSGGNLVSGVAVLFGNELGAEVSVASDRRATVKTPAGVAAGKVSVRVTNPDGKSSVLADAFTYDDGAGPIADAVLGMPALTVDESGQAMVRVTVTAQVSAPGITNAPGQGQPMRAQVGFAPDALHPDAGSFTWVDAAYAADVEGGARDSYSAELSFAGVTGMAEAAYVLAARFSADGAASWVRADRDGSKNGVTDDQLARLLISRRTVGWCKLGGELIEAPPSLSLRLGQPSPTIYGQVYAQGLTDTSGAGPSVVGQLGHGRAAMPIEQWAWVAATFNRDTNNGANDEYQASLPLVAGDERFAFRFGVDGGPWRYCDADGLANGYSDDQAGKLEVKAPSIDECHLQFPSALQSVQTQTAGPVYGQVTAVSVTESAGAGPGVEGQLGLGVSTDPVDGGWAWAAAQYNVEAANGAEEWRASFLGPAPGTYHYGYRFRLQSGPWRYCDGLGTLTANAFTPVVTACKLQFVSASSIGSGDPVTAYGRAVLPGFSTSAGVTAGLRGQVGVGTQGDNASSSAAWGWAEAAYSGDVADAGADEFVATVRPAYSGTRAVSFRFSVNDGGTWLYCDQNGSEVNGYEVGEQWPLSVGNASNIDYCSLQYPPTVSQSASSGPKATVYGQIYVANVTPMGGADQSISAQLGYGPKQEDPGVSAKWVWSAAAYNPTCTTCGANNDEYQATFNAPAGSYAYAFRFSRNGGSNFCYGDFDGSGTALGFNGEAGANDNLGAASVSP